MLFKVFSCCLALGMIGNLLADDTVMEEKISKDNKSVSKAPDNSQNATMFITSLETSDSIEHVSNKIIKFAKNDPSINAKQLYEGIKKIRFEEGKNKETIKLCNLLMSYFRAQSLDQNGDTIREKLQKVLEAMKWIYYRENNKTDANYLTNFRMVSFLLTPEVFPHLTNSQRILVLHMGKEYIETMEHHELLEALDDTPSVMTPGLVINEAFSKANTIQNQFTEMRKLIAGFTVNKNETVEELNKKIIDLTKIMQQLKTKSYKINGVEYRYSKTEIKSLEWKIATLINQMILRRNNISEK